MITQISLTKMPGTRDSHWMTQHLGVVFAVTRLEYDMPYRSIAYRIEASKPCLWGKMTCDVDTLFSVRDLIGSPEVAEAVQKLTATN